MLELVVWGVALLLLVKGLDVLHPQALAANRGELGAPSLARVTAAIAIMGSVALAYLASNARPVPQLGGLATYEHHDEALEAAERYRQRMGTSPKADDGLDTMSKAPQ